MRARASGGDVGSVVDLICLSPRRGSSLAAFKKFSDTSECIGSPSLKQALAKVARADVAARLRSIASDNGPFAANRGARRCRRSSLGRLVKGWRANPVVGTNKATDEISRDRVLSDEELSLIWRNAGDGAYGAIVRLLVLTGQRREEVGGMLWR